jgi:hypothetical protein
VCLEEITTHIDHAHASLSVSGNDSQSLIIDDAICLVSWLMSLRMGRIDIGIEQLLRMVRFKPFNELLELLLRAFGSRKGDYKRRVSLLCNGG